MVYYYFDFTFDLVSIKNELTKIPKKATICIDIINELPHPSLIQENHHSSFTQFVHLISNK